MNNNETDVYFAARSAENCASTLMQRGDSFFNQLRSNAYLEKIARMWKFYYGAYNDSVGYGHKIEFTGEQGELVSLPVNHLGNIIQHTLVMITSTRPTMQARAVNNDYKSLAQTYLANDILDYYMRQKNLEDAIKRATEMSIVLGSGFVKMEWNATAGETYDVDDDGNFTYEGDIQFSTLSPFDVVFDGTKETWDNDWLMVRSFKNRFDIAAKYPEMKDKILSIPTKAEKTVYRLAVWSNDETDDIPVYEFYHKKTESLPDGRYLLFLDGDTVLLDTKLPYRDIPIYRIAPRTILGTPYGYSPMFDVMPIQEGINSLYSTIMTNQNAFGVQNVFIPRGADISVAELGGGMNVIEADAKPEAINLTQTPAEIFKFLEALIQASETISGVNSVSRGNPEASLKSGTALALVQSMSLQFMSGLQQSYVKLIEDVGTSLLNILKDFATTPKVIALVGKNNRTMLKEFTGEQISSIARVIVDVGNPLSRTIAGRVQMAEQMLQMQMIKNPQEYFQVVETGRLDTMYEGDTKEVLLIQKENELLLSGQEVLATMLDSHKLHISEHKSVLADPDLRQDPTLVQNTLAHIQEHINYLRNADPELLALIGEQPLPPQPQEAAPNQMPSQQQAAANGQAAPLPNGGPMQPQSPLPQPGDQINSAQGIPVNLPNMPQVPASALPNPAAQQAAMGNVSQQ